MTKNVLGTGRVVKLFRFVLKNKMLMVRLDKTKLLGRKGKKPKGR